MREYKVYLSGPITGLSYDGAMEYREYAMQQLRNRVKVFAMSGGEERREVTPTGIEGYNPMRGKDYLSELKVISSNPMDYPEAYMSVLSSANGITTRDRWDCMTCDLAIFNVLGAKAVSVGSVIELGWLDAFRKPVVAVMEEGNVHEHAILDELYGWRVDNLDEALDIVKAILLP